MNDAVQMRAKTAGRSGTIDFDVSGRGNVSGHFTLWEGTSQNLLYVRAGSNENCRRSPLYYFRRICPAPTEAPSARTAGGMVITSTVSI